MTVNTRKQGTESAQINTEKFTKIIHDLYTGIPVFLHVEQACCVMYPTCMLHATAGSEVVLYALSFFKMDH